MIIRSVTIVLFLYSLSCSDTVMNKKIKTSTNRDTIENISIKGDYARTINLESLKITQTNKNLIYYLPDTVSLKDTLKGYLVYKSELDSIPIDTSDLKDVRLYLRKIKPSTRRLEISKSIMSDTFYRVYDSLIPIYGITFENKGYQFFDGYIDYSLYLNEGIEDSVRLKKLTTQIIYKVYVK